MKKIVFGIELEGHRSTDKWEVRTWEANGVIERSVRQMIEWEEVADHGFHYKLQVETLEDRLAALLRCREINPTNTVEKMIAAVEAEIAERNLKNLKRAALRAKQQCRRAIIQEGFDELLTLTYRENQQDIVLCKKHFKEWVRRMARALPGFRYCAGFETQDRGAMHVHLATYKLPKHATFKGVKVKAWELGTKVWRSIVGANNGLCYVGGKSRFGGNAAFRGLAQIAAYVSKYIMKDYAKSPAGSNRYSRSLGAPVAKCEVLYLNGCDLATAIGVTFEFNPGDMLVSHRLNMFKDAVWLCVDRGRPDLKGGQYVY